MPQSELLAWTDALISIRGGKGLHVSDLPPVDDPRTIEIPEAVREALKQAEEA